MKQLTREHREALVADNRCPECGCALNAGWECSACGYDAQQIALHTPLAAEVDFD